MNSNSKPLFSSWHLKKFHHKQLSLTAEAAQLVWAWLAPCSSNFIPCRQLCCIIGRRCSHCNLLILIMLQSWSLLLLNPSEICQSLCQKESTEVTAVTAHSFILLWFQTSQNCRMNKHLKEKCLILYSFNTHKEKFHCNISSLLSSWHSPSTAEATAEF